MNTALKTTVIILLFAIGLILCHWLIAIDHSPAAHLQPEYAQRIITLNPSAAQIIYALSAQSKLIAVSTYYKNPKDKTPKPTIGDAINPDLEKIKSLSPDLVITMGKAENITNFCRCNNIEIMRLDMADINGIYNDIILLSKKINSSQAGRQLVDNIQLKIRNLQTRLASLDTPSVFFSFFPSSSLKDLCTVGGDTYLNSLITIAKGRNIFGNLNTPYPQISKETLLKYQPAIIIEPLPRTDLTSDNITVFKKRWQLLKNIPAVKNDRIYFPDADIILKPGINLPQAVELLAKIIHPEAFK